MASKLYIDDELADLSNDASIAITFQKNDIADLSSRQSNYSNNIKLPLSDRNILLHGYANSINSATDKPYKKLPCKLISDGIEIVSDGVLKIEQSDNVFNDVIYSGIAGFFDSLGDKKLSDLNLDEYVAEWSVSGMILQYVSPNSPSVILDDNGHVGLAKRKWLWRELFFSMFVRDIWKAIHEDAGYSFEGSVFSTDDWVKKYLPFTNKYPVQRQFDIDNGHVKAVKLSGVPQSTNMDYDATSPTLSWSSISFQFEQDDPSGSWSTTTYTSPITQIVKVKTFLPITIAISNPNPADMALFIQLRKNGTAIQTTGISKSTGLKKGINVIDFEFNEVTLAENDTVTLFYSFSGINPTSFTGTAVINPLYGDDQVPASIEIIVQDRLPFGGIWHQAANLPDMTQKEFVKSMMQLFFLTPVLFERERKMQYLTWKEVSDTSQSEDFSKYLAQDISKATIIKRASTYARANYLKFLADDNVLEGTGDGVINISDEHLDAEKTLFELKFAASENVYKANGIKMAKVWRYDSDDNDVQPQPRILHYNYVAIPDAVTNGGYIEITDTITGTNNFTYGAFGTFENDFEKQIQEYAPSLVFMLKNYNKVKIKMNIPAMIAANINSINVVYIEQFAEYFYLNKVENWTNVGGHSVELIRL